MTKDTGGQAFPNDKHNIYLGMTLRDYFAGQALFGCVNERKAPKIAKDCYEIADAMIAERSKR